ncbi:flippase [Persephonella sp.]|uniref:flippase n=1 Tax=Persephonella sp. TaxID=2060922 RepID=UPI0026142696|nr:flippase [Persephonella sp.]
MINKIKRLFNTEDKKRLLSNFLSLSILQGANYILPLITLPYLVRVLGPEKFGLIMFAQAFIQYFIILTDYGFNLSATREISINRDNKDKISEIFSSVMIIKFSLMLISFIILTLIVFSFEKFRKEWLVYYLTFGMVVGQVLFPIWFFQGIEKMKYITFLNILAKSIFTVAIFIFVHQVSDYIYVPLLNSLGFIIAGILALWIVFKDFEIKFTKASFESLIDQLKEGWHIFVSTVAISLYTVSNTFILGIFTNNTIVGYYSAAEKIVRAVQGLIIPISNAIYPYISKLVKESEERAVEFLRKLTVFVGSFSFSVSIILFMFTDLIVITFLGKKFENSIIVLKILSFLPFIISLSNIFGIQTMLTFNYKKAFSRILISASVLNILLDFILVPFYKHIGISFAVLISESFVTISMFIFLYKKNIKLLEGKIV